MRFVLTKFVAGKKPEDGTWKPPADCSGSILLSPEMSLDAPIALCGFADDYVSQPGEIDFGAGKKLADCTVTGKQKTGLQNALKLSTTPSATTLDTLLHETLTSLTDPQGSAGPRPMQIAKDGVARYYLGGLLVASFPLTLNSVGASSSLSLVKRTHYEVYQKTLTGEYPPGFQKKYLGAKLQELGLKDTDASLIASPLVPASESQIAKPSTTVSDDFSGTLGAWTATTGTWTISSGAVKCTATNASSLAMMEYTTALSGADHYAQSVWTNPANGGYLSGPMIRSSGATGFGGGHYADTWYFYKVNSSSSVTQIGTVTTAIYPYNPHTLKADISGSGITLWFDGSNVKSITDTSYPSQLKVGMFCNYYTDATHDDFLGDDGIVAGGQPTAKRFGGVEFAGRVIGNPAVRIW